MKEYKQNVEIVRLRSKGLSFRKISENTGMSLSTVVRRWKQMKQIATNAAIMRKVRF